MKPAKALTSWNPRMLPPFPAIAIRALGMLSRDEAALREFYEIIRPDPIFSTEILLVANCPLFAFPIEITSVLQALMLLGTERVKAIVSTVAMRIYMGQAMTPALRSTWRHTLASAIIAEETAKWTPVDKDFAYTAAVMHDVGRVALAALYSQRYEQMLSAPANVPTDLLERECDLFGVDHSEAGAALVKAWDLPGIFREITGKHHHQCSGEQDVTSVVQRSCLLADVLGFGITGFNSPLRYEEVLATFPEGARTRLPVTAEELRTHLTEKIDSVV